MLTVLVASMIACARVAEAALGIPDFLEMGKCVKVPLKEDFDPVKYSGLWFDIESVPNEYQYTKKCVTQNYSWKGDYMNVATRGLTTEDKKIRQGAVMKVEAASVPKPNPAHMTVDAAGVPAAPYQIVSSDYRTYACVYSCLEYFGFRAEFFWIFSRTPTLQAEKIRLCHETFEDLKIDYKKMVPIIQGEVCPYKNKLDQMLQDSEEYLNKVLGPYQPTSSVPTPLPLTTPTPKGLPNNGAVDEELKEIKEIVQEERQVIKDLENKVLLNPKVKLPKETVKTTQQDNNIQGDDPNSAISSVSTSFIIFVSVALTVLIQN